VELRAGAATEGRHYSSFCGALYSWQFCLRRKGVTLVVVHFGRTYPVLWAGMTVAKHPNSSHLKGKLIMKKLVSFVLGAVVLFGAATLGLQSATANAKDRHDKNYWRHHRRHHKHHKHWKKNHLSY